MKKSLFVITMMSIVYLCGCVMAQNTKSLPKEMQPEQIKSVMTKVADWQLANPSSHATTDWTHGALFAGLTAWTQMSGEEKYYNAMLGFGEKNNWGPHKRTNVYHADDHAVDRRVDHLAGPCLDPIALRAAQAVRRALSRHAPPGRR